MTRDATTVTMRATEIDVAAIQAAIRARIAMRRAADVAVRERDRDELERKRLAPLADWNFPRDTWEAMWPPNLEPWNLDEDYPIRSHRSVFGRALVGLKRAQRAVLRVLLRPILAPQVEINRTLALMSRTLATELATERLRVRRLEERLSRVGAVVQELRGNARPIVEIEPE